jgi:hypothetical protein
MIVELRSTLDDFTDYNHERLRLSEFKQVADQGLNCIGCFFILLNLSGENLRKDFGGGKLWILHGPGLLAESRRKDSGT